MEVIIELGFLFLLNFDKLVLLFGQEIMDFGVLFLNLCNYAIECSIQTLMDLGECLSDDFKF